MQWTDHAIVLSARKFGENSATVHLLTASHGLHAGVLRGSSAKQNRGIAQAGNEVSATWNARLAEQLGTLKLELLTPHTAHIMHDAAKLSALASACTLLEQCLPERHPYPGLYMSLHSFLAQLHESRHWQEAYVRLELDILAECGFGLDLETCAATGKTIDLVYVSPKSGRAVCAEAGAPYHEKMLTLPSFLLGHRTRNHVEPAEILAGMKLSSYFLEHWLLAPHGRKLPAARQRLMNTLTAKEAHAP
jgi:DNA repair protein RecO (recombination protein O)